MSEIAVRVEGLGKEYRIGLKQERYRTLRDTIAEAVTAPLRRARSVLRGQATTVNTETIWALRDVSFEVKQGEVIGIIGRNGAGKSTLLKILSRITEPTTGGVDIYGRVGSLLEVGTGFHPELTGRENIYLNGAILGMRRGEIARKFDEIVAFAEVDKFIDTPVKRYSSGMYLRLAFAVAAHLETEVLVVDEVLAVGDAAFQKKCLGKMGEVANAGRTVLFVSHNMAAVQSLCAKGIYLQEGTLAYLGEISYAIQRYHASIFQQSAELVQPVQGVQFQDIRLNGRQDTVIDATRPFEVRVQVVCAKPTARHFLYCLIEDAERSLVVHARVDSSSLMGKVKVTTYTARIQFPALWLKPGAYVMQFKMIVDTVGTKGRYLSDPLMLDVKGNADPALTLGYLAPTIGWDLLSSEAAPGE